MIFEKMPVGHMDSNCYIIGCDNSKECAIVDPGAEGDKILGRIEQLGLNCTKIILTHGHVDHIGALNQVQKATGAKVLIHEKDADMLTNPAKNLSMYMGAGIKNKGADRLLKDQDKIKIGEIELKVLHTPGHTPGGICLKVGSIIMTGDTLFAGSVGRSDFPGGSHTVLIDSIKTKLLVFNDETRVCPGHGPDSTIAIEKRVNPFL